MSDANSILNDPNFTPWTNDGVNLMATHDGTFIIFSSSLHVRYEGTRFGKTRTWLKTPPQYIRGKRR